MGMMGTYRLRHSGIQMSMQEELFTNVKGKIMNVLQAI
jgi:hypothetical protein